MVLGGSQPSPGPLHLRKPSWAPAPGGKATCSRAGVPNCRFSLGRGWRRAGAIPPRTERPLSPPPAALSLSHNPLRRQQPPPPISQAGPGAHPSLGRSAASPSPPVARQARTQLPPFPARSEAAGGGGTRRPARPPPLAMEGDKVRGRCGPAGEPGEPAGRRPGPAPADTARGAAPPRPFPPPPAPGGP